MRCLDETIGYAVRIGSYLEVRIVDENGDQKCVPVGNFEAAFDNLQWVSERISAEKRQRAA